MGKLDNLEPKRVFYYFEEITKIPRCSLKEDKDGNFNLNIDGVSHVSWFRRKKNEFMETLGVPTRKQDKGIRL